MKTKIISITNILIVINLIMFYIQNSIQNGTLYFGLNQFLFEYKLYHQPLSTMFVHSGFLHIAMNMFVLFQFGNMIEAHIGWLRFLILYLIGGVLTSVGSLGYMYFVGDWANLIGASGAISVLLGWYALKVPSERKAIIIWVLLISFAPLVFGMPIGWYSHLIGFVLGWIFGYFI